MAKKSICIINYLFSTNNKRKIVFINGKIKDNQKDGELSKWNGMRN